MHQAQHSPEGGQDQAALLAGELHRGLEVHGGQLGQDGERLCPRGGRGGQGRGVRQRRQGLAAQVDRHVRCRASDHHVVACAEKICRLQLKMSTAV